MNPETVIKVRNHDSDEMLKRLKGMRGYLSSRAASNLNDMKKMLELSQMIKAVEECESRIMNIAPTKFHRTEAAR